ncbi:MAG TPA: hypothetical protein VMV46_18490 [Thermoanaerobaculia bacterium]|nr:hypothetical protein [Thermoanaerobaculia bacterium]
MSQPSFTVTLPDLRRWLLTVAPGVLALAIAHAGHLALRALPSIDPSAAGETLFLARVALIVLLLLLAPAALLRGAALAAWCATTLATVALLWTLPAGPTLGFAVSGALVLTLAVTVARLGGIASSPNRPARAGAPGAPLPLGVVLPIAVALQCLALPADLLAFPLDGRTLVRLFALPAAACLAGALLARQRGTLVAVAAVAAPLAIAGRFTVAVLVAVAVPILAEWLSDRRLPGPARAGALIALLLPFARDPVLGVLALLGALALSGRRAWPAALVVATGMLALLPPQRGWTEAAALLPWLLLVAPLPAARWLGALGPERRPGLAAAAWELSVPLLLGWIALRFAPPASALAVPALLLALGLERPGATDPTGTATTPSGRVDARWQLGWPALWLIGSLLVACYPWLRAPGATGLAQALGLDRAPWLPAVLALTLLVLVAATRTLGRRARQAPARWQLAAALLVVLAASSLARAPGRSLLTWPAVELAPGRSQWSSPELPWPGGPAVAVIDSAVAFGSVVATGTAVATLRWITEPEATGAGAPQHPVTLRLGVDTAEWSAGSEERPGIAPWLSQVGPQGDALVHRYRARRALGALPSGPGRLIVERADGLPEDLRLSLYRVRLVAGAGGGAVPP